MEHHTKIFSEVPHTAVDWRARVDFREHATGCPWHDCKSFLRQVGLRPTRQRLLLGWVLFSKGNRHVTADMLYDEALTARIPVSLATIYNTLHQFTQAGLLREISATGGRAYFDTNPSEHHHFLVEDEDVVMDIPNGGQELLVDRAPQAPEGYEIDRVDVVVRLRRTEPART